MKLRRDKSVMDWWVLETKTKNKTQVAVNLQSLIKGRACRSITHRQGTKQAGIRIFKQLHSFRVKSLLADGCRPR